MYNSPFNKYASESMINKWSDTHRHTIWRELWISLAIVQKNLGLNITQQQIDEMLSNYNKIDYDVTNAYEQQTHHDVMAHILAFGDQCPTARPIMHLGATSCYITDNADIIIMKDALCHINVKLSNIITTMEKYAYTYRGEPMVAYTHFQPAQLTTVGKRICMWLQDFVDDLNESVRLQMSMKMLGSKGAVGTQASFLQLFNGDYNKVDKMDYEIGQMYNMNVVPISGQTYSRKLDSRIFDILSGIAQSAAKFATDMRLLAHTDEIREKFHKDQVGSSAMPYKHNPMLCERICGIARFVVVNQQNAAITASSQWLERTLDDSSNRRIVVPQMFMAIDSILDIIIQIFDEIEINVDKIRINVADHMPYILTEYILMNMVIDGGDRQDIHRRLSSMSRDRILDLARSMLIPTDSKSHIGCAVRQVEKYIDQI